MPQTPPIPPAFAAKKYAILASLALPSSDYSDLSPKGSVDEAIIPLIQTINALEGVVTTSSCAGRVSVFLEGRKGESGLNNGTDEVNERDRGDTGSEQIAVPGGKGKGGRWLFVSHKPAAMGQAVEAGGSLMNVFGIVGQNKRSFNVHGNSLSRLGMRMVRFQFEPMILHIMTASLAHASSVLAAAINAGFRESGVQSLKNLDDPLNAFPMVAVRTSGLAFQSLVGYVGDETPSEAVQAEIQTLVSEDYLRLLLDIANERFQANTQRMKRFEAELLRRGPRKGTGWEEAESRQARKRADGLARRDALRNENK